MKIGAGWHDEFVRSDPLRGAAIDGDGQGILKPPARLKCGRNEFAGFQITAGPGIGARDTTVTVAPLKGPGGNEIKAGLMDVFVEWYIRINEQWYPEILVPADIVGGSTSSFRRRNGVNGQAYAGFWIDVFVPAGTEPGMYTGNFEIRFGADRIEFPVELDVAETTLPDIPCLDLSLNNYVDSISPGWPELRPAESHLATAAYRRVEQGVFRAAQDNRAFIHYMPYGHSGYIPPRFVPRIEGEGARKRVADWSGWDRHFGPYFDGSAFRRNRRGPIPVGRFYMPLNLNWPADFVKFGRPGYAAEWRAVGRQIVDHFRKKGWTQTHFDMFLNHKQRFGYFPWDAEEMRFLEDNDLHRYFRTLWEGTYDRASTDPVMFDYTLGTTWSYGWDIKSDLADFIDVFIAGTSGPSWHGDQTAGVHKKGAKVWTCGYAGNTTMPMRAPAFMPLLMWMRDLDGFMPAWCSIGGWHNDPYRALPEGGGITYLYPGSEFGSEDTFPSIRLKVLRNGIQMTDRFQSAADRLGSGRAPVWKKIDALLKMRRSDWFSAMPADLKGKIPREWRDADFATEEPPLAGWNKFTTDQYRSLRQLSYCAAGDESASRRKGGK